MCSEGGWLAFRVLELESREGRGGGADEGDWNDRRPSSVESATWTTHVLYIKIQKIIVFLSKSVFIKVVWKGV